MVGGKHKKGTGAPESPLPPPDPMDELESGPLSEAPPAIPSHGDSLLPGAPEGLESDEAGHHSEEPGEQADLRPPSLPLMEQFPSVPSVPSAPRPSETGKSLPSASGLASISTVPTAVVGAPTSPNDEELSQDLPTRPVAAAAPVSPAPADDSRPPSIPSAARVVSAEVPFARTEAAAAEALAGDVIAERYQVDSVLGEGGMGIVYRCIDQMSGEPVALKRVVVPDIEHAEEYVMWFYKEARALAALAHPGIVRARDFGRLQDGSPFLVMDIASGTSLHDLSHAGLEWPHIYHIIDQILGALAHAHARGIVHGDLKPSNVLVEDVAGEPPRVHVLDFGLAWLKSDMHDERLDGEKAPEVKPHAGAGTPGYMAPEQIQHEQHHVCGATDLYALGCILYRLIGRGPPFGGTPKELLRQHAYSEVPLVVPAFDAPAGLVEFTMRMLEKRPWQRWEFAAEARRQWRTLGEPDASAAARPLPRIRSAPARPLPAGRGYRGRNPRLDAEKDRTTSLINIRQAPMVGREDITNRLLAACQEVISSPVPLQRLVILVGPAGSGKSRIAESVCQMVHEQGLMVPLHARYRPMRGPMDGIVGAVTRYYNFERADRSTIERSLLQRWQVRKSDREGRTWVAGAAEWLRPTGQAPDAPVGPSGVRFALDTVATRRTVSRHVVRQIGHRRKLLFWLDDLHNASDSTFEGFQRMAQEDKDQPYLIVATVRAEDVHLGTPAAERLRTLREAMNGLAIDVPPLEPETTRELLRRSIPLEEDAVEEAARRSRGNPLFALQQLHAWALEGKMELREGVYRVPADALAVRPKTTAELWESRVDAIPERFRLAAYATAAISSDLRREVLRPLLDSLGLPGDECIFAMQRAEVLIPRGPGRYSWPHALLQEHLFAQLAERSDRTRIYRAAAAALTQHPLAGSRRVVRQRVLNLLHAGDADAAASLLFGFLQDTWNGAREPLSTLSDLDLLRGRLEGEMRAHQDRWRAEALRHVGRTLEAREYAERARTAFHEMEDAVQEAHALRLLGHINAELGNTTEGKRLASAALLIFQSRDDIVGQAQAEAVLAEIGYLLGDSENARILVQDGEKHFASADQPLGRGQCLLLSSWIEHSEGAIDRSRRLATKARAEFERVGYRLGMAQAGASLAHVEHRTLNLNLAMAGAEEALAAFESLRTPRGQAACRRLLAMIGVDMDDPDMAARHLEWAAKIYGDIDDPWGTAECKVLEAEVALMQRKIDVAHQKLLECVALEVEEPEPHQHRLLVEAWLLHEQGSPSAAGERIAAALRCFPSRRRVGDHTPQLLARLSRLAWPSGVSDLLWSWRSELLQPKSPTSLGETAVD